MRLYLILIALTAAALFNAAAARADDSDNQKAPEHKITQSKSYMMVDPLYTTIVDGDRPAGMLMVGVGLDVPDDALRTEVVRSMPVLRDAYLRNLMAFTATTVRTDAQPDVTVIADRLQTVTDRALKHKGARILLAQIALRVSGK